MRILVGETFTLESFGADTEDRAAVRAATAEIMRRITVLVEELRGEKAPRPYDVHYDGDPGKNHRGVRRPDPAPGAESGTTGAGGSDAPPGAGPREAGTGDETGAEAQP